MGFLDKVAKQNKTDKESRVERHLSAISSDYELRLSRKIGTCDTQGACYPVHHELARGLLFRLALQGGQPVRYMVDDSDWGFYNLENRRQFEEVVKGGIETKLIIPYLVPEDEQEYFVCLEDENPNFKFRWLGLSRNTAITNCLLVGDSLMWRTILIGSLRGKSIATSSPEIAASVYFNPEKDAEFAGTSELFDIAFED